MLQSPHLRLAPCFRDWWTQRLRDDAEKEAELRKDERKENFIKMMLSSANRLSAQQIPAATKVLQTLSPAASNVFRPARQSQAENTKQRFLARKQSCAYQFDHWMKCFLILRRLQETRESLPVFEHRDRIVRAVQENNV
jgi:hypothetical protein